MKVNKNKNKKSMEICFTEKKQNISRVCLSTVKEGAKPQREIESLIPSTYNYAHTPTTMDLQGRTMQQTIRGKELATGCRRSVKGLY